MITARGFGRKGLLFFPKLASGAIRKRALPAPFWVFAVPDGLMRATAVTSKDGKRGTMEAGWTSKELDLGWIAGRKWRWCDRAICQSKEELAVFVVCLAKVVEVLRHLSVQMFAVSRVFTFTIHSVIVIVPMA